jgi:DNA-binding transcriptional LysR family regulator
MDMRQIRHLIAVLEHGNVLRAAHAIHISQPALSKSIQNLEAELGVRLLERGPRGVSPTIYGTTLLKHGRLLLNQGEQAVAEIAAIKDGHLGHLRLGVANFAIHFLPAVLAKLLSSKPDLSVDIVDGTYEGLTVLVREGALDAVVSGLPPLHRAEDLIHEELTATEFVRVCRPDYRPFQRAEVPMAALSQARWILPNRPQAIIDLWELAFRGARVAPPKPVLQSASMMFIKAMLMEGQFLTVLPRGIVEPEVQSGHLKANALRHPFAMVTEGIIYRAGGVHPPALFALIDAIRAAHDEDRTGTSTSDPTQRVPRSRTSTPRRFRKRRARRSDAPRI